MSHFRWFTIVHVSNLFPEALSMEAGFSPHVVFHWPLKMPRRTRSEYYQRKISYAYFSPYKRKQISVFAHTFFSCWYCLFFFFLAVLWDMWDLSSPTSQPGTESVPPAVKARNLNCWTSREVPILPSLVMQTLQENFACVPTIQICPSFPFL